MVNLKLLQLGDSALPVGGYTHSWGLETAIARGAIHDAATLENWTQSWLTHAVAPMEGVVVGAACRAAAVNDWSRVRETNQLVTASIAAPSIRSASREMGEQLLALAATWEWSRDRIEEFAANIGSESGESESGGCNYCVAFAVVAAAAGGSAEEALGVFLNQAALGMIAAGVRGIPIGHTHAQQILAYLHDDIQELTRSCCKRDITTAGSGSPYYEVLCYEQPRLYTRLFRS
jgi:urease accessory protein